MWILGYFSVLRDFFKNVSRVIMDLDTLQKHNDIYRFLFFLMISRVMQGTEMPPSDGPTVSVSPTILWKMIQHGSGASRKPEL